jgi:hypothetical protein
VVEVLGDDGARLASVHGDQVVPALAAKHADRAPGPRVRTGASRASIPSALPGRGSRGRRPGRRLR